MRQFEVTYRVHFENYEGEKVQYSNCYSKTFVVEMDPKQYAIYVEECPDDEYEALCQYICYEAGEQVEFGDMVPDCFDGGHWWPITDLDWTELTPLQLLARQA